MQLAFLLAEHNHRRFFPSLPTEGWQARLKQDYEIVAREIEWIETLRQAVSPLASHAPHDQKRFLTWFEGLQETGPGQGDPLFPWLAQHATREQLRWFIFQEVGGEAGFEDLVALTQLKLETRPKLEMARNYWDEMGRGAEVGMHGPMLGRTADELRVTELKAEYVIPAVELSNMLSALAFHRRYAHHSIGALGAVELTAPGRTALVAKGLRRVDVSKTGTQYYTLHSTLDIKHSRAWNAEIIAPLAEKGPAVTTAIAEGALMRLTAGALCFEAYRAHFAQEGADFGSVRKAQHGR